MAQNNFRVIGFYPALESGYSGFKQLGAWLLARAPRLAMWLEDRVTLPIGVRAQRVLRPAHGLLPSLPADTRAPGGLIITVRE